MMMTLRIRKSRSHSFCGCAAYKYGLRLLGNHEIKSKWFQDHLSLSTIIRVSLICFTKSDLSLFGEKGVQQDETSQIFLLNVECRTPKRN